MTKRKPEEAQPSLFDTAEDPLPRPTLRERLSSQPPGDPASSGEDEALARPEEEKAQADQRWHEEHPDLAAEVRANTPEELDNFDTLAEALGGPVEEIPFEGQFAPALELIGEDLNGRVFRETLDKAEGQIRDSLSPCPACAGSGMMPPPGAGEKVPCVFC